MVGSDVTFICTLVLNYVILGSENALLMVDVQLSRDETPLALPRVTVTGTTFTYTTVVNSFGRNDSGNYTCTATVRPQPSATYLTGNETLSSTINIRAGKYSLTLSLYIPHSQKFLLDKNFPQPSYLCIAEIFRGINFLPCAIGYGLSNY